VPSSAAEHVHPRSRREAASSGTRTTSGAGSSRKWRWSSWVQLLCLLVLMNRYVLGRSFAASAETASIARTPRRTDRAIIVPLYNEARASTAPSSAWRSRIPREKLRGGVVDDCSTDDSYAWACAGGAGDRRTTVCETRRTGQAQGDQPGRSSTSAEFVVSVTRTSSPTRGRCASWCEFVSPRIAAVAGAPSSRARPQRLTRMVAGSSTSRRSGSKDWSASSAR